MTSAIPIEAIAVSIVLADGSVVAAPQDRGFYGTRGQDRPLHGFELRFSAPWAERLQCSYSGRFIDGITVGPLAPGEVCRSPSGAALESFEILVTER